MKFLFCAGVLLLLATSAQCEISARSGSAHDRAFTNELHAYFDLLKIPGMSVAVVQQGKIIYRHNEGFSNVDLRTPVSDDAIFSIASVTKTFTGVMMMQLEKEGRISLNDYLLKYPLDTNLYSPHRIDPNVRLRDVLSMTSGGVPGTTFSYNGGRFNFLSGVFDSVSGKRLPESYSSQVQARIVDRLHMTSTFDGYPAASNALTSRVVKRYRIDASKDGIAYVNVPYDSQAAYPAPAAGLFSDIDDLATYAIALDNNTLISHDQYVEMTTPTVRVKGHPIPYGYGWLTQVYRGVKLDWAYGEGDLDSALFLRVPERELTFIFLANSGAPSHAARLNSGNVLRSPFAVAFLKHFVFEKSGSDAMFDYDGDIAVLRKEFFAKKNELDPIHYEEPYTQALVRNYMRTALHQATLKPEQLTRLLFEVHPQSFDTADIPLIVLLSRIDSRDLRPAAERLIQSFDLATERRPEALYFIGKYYEANGDSRSAMKYFQLLGDEQGFVDEGAKIDACLLLGKLYRKQGNEEKAREYIWRSYLYAKDAGYSQAYLAKTMAELSEK